MDCEICGKDSSDLFLISVEGTRLTVCRGCSHCGTFISEVKEQTYDTVKVREEAPEIDFIENYAELIRENRTKAGLSQEELAKKLNESLNVIKKIEKGSMTPTEKLAVKFEKLFKIKLFQTVKKEDIKAGKTGLPFSLEDIATIKK